MMTDPRHIHDYLDGTIDSAAEASLFAAMANDPDARRELNDQIRLHLAVKKDMAAIAAPADAAAAIFGELGYALPADLAPVAQPTPQRRRRWLLPIWFLLFLGTGIIATRLWWPTVITNTKVITQQLPAQSPTPGPTQSPTQRPTQSPTQRPTQRPTQSPTQSPPIQITQSLTQGLTQGLTQRPTQGPTQSPTQRPTQSLTQRLTQRPTDEPWRIIAAGLSTLSTGPSFGTDSAASSAWSQFTVGVSYHLNDDDVVSVVGGRQLVAQEFVRNEWGRDVTYRQTPLLWWGGVMAEHTFSDLNIAGAVTPYASGTLGWMQTGPMARLGAGIHLFRHQQLSFDLGVEGTVMTYPIQSTYYTSTTFTISYGLSYRF